MSLRVLRVRTIHEFSRFESLAGLLLFTMAIAAMIMDNSPFSYLYDELLSTHVAIHFGQYNLEKPLILWINEGLMTIFFLLVGLEIKREILEGELNSISKIALPGIGAVGGMLFPALVFVFINRHNGLALNGWAIPTATDIAFSLGILSLLGPRVPVSLKVFLTALAIMDDIGAIAIIAIFYTNDLSLVSLSLAAVGIIILYVMNRSGVIAVSAYFIIGAIIWLCVLKSGVHATLTGVVLAMAIPIRDKKNPDVSPLRFLECALHPWVAFLVLPVFAFANAGVSFKGTSWDSLLSNIPVGIMLGLFLGKQIGIFLSCWISIKCGFAGLPQQATWSGIYGIALICGVGFTMSLFIGSLAYPVDNIEYERMVRTGVLVGSLFSGVAGYLVLRFVGGRREPT